MERKQSESLQKISKIRKSREQYQSKKVKILNRNNSMEPKISSEGDPSSRLEVSHFSNV